MVYITKLQRKTMIRMGKVAQHQVQFQKNLTRTGVCVCVCVCVLCVCEYLKNVDFGPKTELIIPF